MIDYLWQYISHYTAIIKSLQIQKTLLNQCLQKKHDVTSQNGQKWLAGHISIMKSIFKKLNIFHHLQILFLRFTIFSHFNSKHQLYIDLDVSKKFDFNVHIYHSKSKINLMSLFSQKNTKSIFFFNYLFTDAETQYWFTELEVADIVWMIKKIHYMIETAEQIIIIYTDYFIIIFIVQQSSLNTVNIEKLNFLSHTHIKISTTLLFKCSL